MIQKLLNKTRLRIIQFLCLSSFYKYFLIIVFYTIFNNILFSQTVFDIISPFSGNPEQLNTNSYFSLSNTYNNIYKKNRNDKENDYIWFNSSKLELYKNYKTFEVKGSLNKTNFHSKFIFEDKFLNKLQLDHESMSFNINIKKTYDTFFVYQNTYIQEYPGLGLGLGVNFNKTQVIYKSDFYGKNYDFTYRTENQEETINLPYYFYSNELLFIFENLKIKSKIIIPINNICTEPFEFELHGNYYEFELINKYFEAYYSQLSTDAELYYNKSNYGSLNNLELIQYYFLFKRDLFNLELQTGLTALQFSIDDNSHIDSVPFDKSAGLYPLRFILADAKFNITAPNISIHKEFKSKKSSFNMSFYYYYIFQNNHFIHKEREYITDPFPLFYKYNEYKNSYDVDINSLVKINLNEIFHINKLKVIISFSQLIPFKLENIKNLGSNKSSSSSNSNSSYTVWGGTSLKIEASVPF